MKKRIICMCLAFFMAVAACWLPPRDAEAAGMDAAPLDIVIVVDNSGSMNRSDRGRLIAKAIKMLINMMPCDSQVGVIGFNSQPNVLTRDASGAEALISLEKIDDVKIIREVVDGMPYDGHTGIGNALKKATDMLGQLGRSDAQKAVILFTDGLDDLESEVEFHTCDSNQTDAVYWASTNNCPVYSIGLNYVKDDGTSTLGANGEGTQKLGGISSMTGGTYTEIADISQVEQLFIDILANIRQLYYNEIEVVPGDGGNYEIPIDVNASVIEANIRISCATPSALTAENIVLEDPNGNPCDLYNSANIRTDIESTAVSIKVIAPQQGIWKLKLSGIVGDDVKIGLLEHYSLGIEAQLEVPSGTVTDTAYMNDVVTIRAFLSSGGERLMDEAYYQSPDMKVTASVVPRTDATRAEEITLLPQGASYAGSFTVSLESAYDIYVQIDTQSYYRDTQCVLYSANRPFVLKREQLMADIPEISVNVRKQATIDGLVGTYTADNENDAVTAAITYLSDDTVAEITYDTTADQVIVKGKKWGSAIATLTFTDAQNNTETIDIKVKVKDPLLLFILVAGPIILIVLVVCILLFGSYKALKKYPGDLTVRSVSWESGKGRVLFNNIETMRTVEFLKRGKSLWGVLSQYADLLKMHGDDNVQSKLRETFFSGNEDAKALRVYASELKFLKTSRGKKGILLKSPKKTMVAAGNGKPNGMIKRYLLNATVVFTVYLNPEATQKVVVELEQSTRKAVRGGKKSRVDLSESSTGGRISRTAGEQTSGSSERRRSPERRSTGEGPAPSPERPNRTGSFTRTGSGTQDRRPQ